MTAHSHSFSFRVYYEDTDVGGVVYYANYLKFAERARTEYLRNVGISQSELKEKEGAVFVVRHATLDLRSPARLDDLLEVKTVLKAVEGAKLLLHQNIYQIGGGEDGVRHTLLSTVDVTIVCVDISTFRPRRVPEGCRKRLQEKS